ncbi:MAG: hypothetical protein J7L39_03735, partial [Candidatus Aenigmarchaeota archaeon]|nr:hypothetical protein [Candidatus Aenigmarchaeota archaeon]
NTTKKEIKGEYKKSFLIVNEKKIVFCSMNVTTNTQKQRHFVKKNEGSKITLTGYHSSSSPLNFFINFFDSIYRHVNSLFSSVISFFNK